MQYTDPDFGQIQVTVNPRARRIIMRAEIDGLRVTAPSYATPADIVRAIDHHRQSLIHRQKQVQAQPRHTDDEIAQLRRQAKAALPRRVAELAHMHHFEYQTVKIQSSRTRWGSCSARNSINLTLYVMTLPPHLVDYVILHELCHTVHHDHSPHFWSLMDQVTQGRAAQWNKELRTYHPL